MLCFDMKKIYFTLLLLVLAGFSYATNIFTETFEYANHDGEVPLGWTCNDQSWLCGYLEKDHNRIAHTGDWYAYTNADDAWMFMPIYQNSQLKYRYSFWSISDGSFEVEFWAGNEMRPESMSQRLFTVTVNSGEYEYFSEYIETITENYDFLGIHAIAATGAFHLSIDDIDVDMIERYALHASPAENDTILVAGSHITFNCKVQNDGYEPFNAFITSYSSYFDDIQFSINGEPTNSFHLVQDEVVTINGVATLHDDVEPGTSCWFDVMFTLDCNCATAMYTYWATVVAESVEEHYADMSVYPNPSKGNVTIEGNGLISIFNLLGQEVFKTEVIGKETVMLEPGIYFLRKKDNSVTKIIVEF